MAILRCFRDDYIDYRKHIDRHIPLRNRQGIYTCPFRDAEAEGAPHWQPSRFLTIVIASATVEARYAQYCLHILPTMDCGLVATSLRRC
ncbi:uncharacterized protein GLRG_02061 [Colletotrichum graminicola M1.001]|uniref:Uncharacterized protein n=1 Tax=Colletotrichum graminicola (strain M1.001 / M2 / FGSC 10212) TaxID=645133 RepID=E3Q8L9_COLGM|nr:uncharacterized protein GLRG_02061 [Colletotrichum graminicola M1.001]EFQ26890.1 hypothetical protein GLRG_02061 [Colletotrichum graminicola M1.001]